MSTTRRGFIAELASTFAVAPVVGYFPEKHDGDFRDLQVGCFYFATDYEVPTSLQSYPVMGDMLVKMFEDFRHPEESIEDFCQSVEDMKLCLIERRKDNPDYEIPLTKNWLMEFYRRHKDETFDIWKSKYDDFNRKIKNRKGIS